MKLLCSIFQHCAHGLMLDICAVKMFIIHFVVSYEMTEEMKSKTTVVLNTYAWILNGQRWCLLVCYNRCFTCGCKWYIILFYLVFSVCVTYDSIYISSLILWRFVAMIYLLCWIFSTVQVIFDMHRISGTDFYLISRWVVVIILVGILHYYF